MTTKSPIRKVKPEKVAILHACSETSILEQLIKTSDKLSIIITGNGNPENGLCRQVALIVERQTEVVKKLDKIEESLTDFHKKYEETKDIAVMAKNAIDKFKDENIVKEKTKEEIKAEKRAKITIWIKTLAFIVSAIALCFMAYGVIKTNHKSDKIIEKSDRIINETEIINFREKTKAQVGGVLIPAKEKPFILDTVRVDSIIKARAGYLNDSI